MLSQEHVRLRLAEFKRMIASQKPMMAQKTCANLGESTAELVECKTCSGRVQLKVFECHVFGTCTIARKVDGVACCDGGKCKSYKG